MCLHGSFSRVIPDGVTGLESNSAHLLLFVPGSADSSDSSSAAPYADRLERAGYRLTRCRSIAQLRELYAPGQIPEYSVAILRGDSHEDALSAARLIRARSRIPLIFLVADSARGAASGADAPEFFQALQLFNPCTLLADPPRDFDLQAAVATALCSRQRETERARETEESLFESRRFIRGITEAIPAILYTYDIREERILYINQLAEEILGYTPREIVELGRSFFERVLLPEDRGRIPARLASYSRTRPGEILESEIQLHGGNGERCWLSVRELVYVRDAEGRPRQVIGTAQDITRRKDAEFDLIQEKEWQIVTLYALSDGVISTDRQGRIISMNPAARRLFGFRSLGEAAGRGIDEIYTLIDDLTGQELACPVRRALREGEGVEYFTSVRMQTEDGRELSISLAANPLRDEGHQTIGAVAILRDETAKVRTEREMRKIQALDSLGILAGGIAHDFNNVMTAIQNHITLACLRLQEPEFVEGRLRSAERALSRVQGLTRQLLTFASGGDPIKRTIAVHEVIVESADFVLRGNSTEIQYQIAPGLWPADLDETQFSTVINNLVINASHSMPAEDGRIWIECVNIAPRDATASSPAGHDPHHGSDARFPDDFPHAILSGEFYIRVTVSDNGSGIPPENLARVFDPYFTTKENGTGLGLSSAYSIIKRHEGLLRVHSRPGQGTRFQIFLPARPGATTAARGVSMAELPPAMHNFASADSEEDLDDDHPLSTPTQPTTMNTTTQHRARILIMDDEDDIRETLGLLLERMGYAVTDAGDGATAVERFREAREAQQPFDVVILDLTVPGGMGGLEAARAMQVEQTGEPGTRLIASSGYSSDPVLAHFGDYGFTAALAKPFRMRDLQDLIESVLAGEAS